MTILEPHMSAVLKPEATCSGSNVPLPDTQLHKDGRKVYINAEWDLFSIDRQKLAAEFKYERINTSRCYRLGSRPHYNDIRDSSSSQTM